MAATLTRRRHPLYEGLRIAASVQPKRRRLRPWAGDRQPVEPGQLVDPSRHAPPGFHTAVEVRWVRSSGIDQAAWFRLPMAVIDGETTTPLMRAAAVSDFANALARRALCGTGPVASDFVNADLTVHLARSPEGDWIGLRLDRVAENRGVSYLQATLFDRQGPVDASDDRRLAGGHRGLPVLPRQLRGR